MRRDAVPSDLFIGAIRQGYDQEAAKGGEVEPAAIWDHIVIECLRTSGGFLRMFAWDTSKAKDINRIGTIIECLERGLVPGLSLECRGRRRVVVVTEG